MTKPKSDDIQGGGSRRFEVCIKRAHGRGASRAHVEFDRPRAMATPFSASRGGIAVQL